LTIAIQDENASVVRKAVQAAMNFANRPMMVPVRPANIVKTSDNALQKTPAPIENNNTYDGYEFQSSSLHDGLLLLLSRLLRPIWCKPVVVVIEQKKISPRQRRDNTEVMPAKVELLLDEVTLQDVRRPLAAIKDLMRDMFAPAISVIPGGKQGLSGKETISVNDSTVGNDVSGGKDLITSALRYQSQTPVKKNFTSQPSIKDLNAIACLKEERSLHSLYRLVSRTVQALHLMSRLRHAHLTPELPEVEFGLLHGLTFSQLVTMKSAQDRVETVLTHLFSGNQAMASLKEFESNTSTSSVETNTLSSVLSSQCYLYFSIGSR